MCSWTGSGSNQWTTGTSTPSSGTGPTSAHAGTHFVFLETSYGNAGDLSYLTSPTLAAGVTMVLYGHTYMVQFGYESYSMQFGYHMYGASMGTLSVQALSSVNSWTSVWSKSGQQQASQTSPWLNSGMVHLLRGTTRVRFAGTQGGSYTGDMAVDTVQFTLHPGASFSACTQ